MKEGDGTTKAAILCGGEGKRLRPLTNYFQKTMVPIGAKRKPLLEYVVKLLVHHGIRDITMLTGYREEDIVNYFGDGYRFNARVSYSKDTIKTKGSAGALANALSSGKIGKCDNLVVYYGDILSDLDVRSLINTHRKSQADATLVSEKGYTLPVGVAQVNEGMISSLTEKPTLPIDITTGNMIIGRKALRMLRKSASKIQGDLMKDFIPLLIKKEQEIGAFYINSFWYDVGTIEKYQSINNRLIEKHLGFLEK